MGRQMSGKRGLQSTGRKAAASRHGIDPMPATSPVAGAYGKGDRVTPKRVPPRRPIGKRSAGE
jgi:hypothetical protein